MREGVFMRGKIALIFLAVLSIMVFLIGCEQAKRSANEPANTAPVAQAPPANGPETQPKVETSANAPFTMPMLYSLLSDESFASEAKSSVKLTDQELDKLKSAVNDSMNELDENDTSQRSAKASNEQAQKKVREVLGADKGDALIALVQQRWTGEKTGAVNSVPTDTRVVVNIPEFRMDVFDRGKLVKTYQIGIGYPEFPLPSGLRKAGQIIINPSWTPPDEPWVKGKWQPHVKVDPGSKLNPLGVLKIPIGAPNLIHGGKAQARIGNFASHGCVGLTDQQVEDFAVLISGIAGEPLSLADIKKYEKQKTETKTIDLANEIPVELRYETIVLENGTLRIFRDVYERGTNTQDNLLRVLQAHGISFDQLDDPTRTAINDAIRQMNTDATGQPVEVKTNVNKGKGSSQSDKVTRNIKGSKSIDIPIPQLAGKGYPMPISG